MSKLTEKQKESVNRFGQFLQKGNLENELLLKYLSVIEQFGNIQTLAQYCKENNVNYNTIKTKENVFDFGGVKFIIDNE